MSGSADIANDAEPPLKRQRTEQPASNASEMTSMEQPISLVESFDQSLSKHEPLSAEPSMEQISRSSAASVSPTTPSVTKPFILPGLTLLKPDVEDQADNLRPTCGVIGDSAPAGLEDETKVGESSDRQEASFAQVEQPPAHEVEDDSITEKSPPARTDMNMEQQNGSITGNSTLNRAAQIETAVGLESTKEEQAIAFAAAAEAQKNDNEAEWQADSSDDSSSSDSDSEEDDSSDDGDEGPLLSAEEAVAMMMRDDSPDSTIGRSKKGISVDPMMTKNEVREADPDVPDVQIDAAMPIEELGILRSIIDRRAIVEGTCADGDTVLNTGTVVCLPNRTVVGIVVEPIGQVKSPYYWVAFKKDEDGELPSGIEEETRLFFSTEHAVFAFSRELQQVKYTDASNFFDEEAQDDEIEFSDDEQEAAYKRERKAEMRRGKGDKRGRGGRGGRRGRGDRDDRAGWPSGERVKSPGYPSGKMNYGDDEDEEMYTPLKRPTTLTEEQLPPSRPNQSLYPVHRDRGADRSRAAQRGGHDSRGGHQFSNQGPPQAYDFNGQSFTYQPPQNPTHSPYAQYATTYQGPNGHPMFFPGTNIPFPVAGQTGQSWSNPAPYGIPPPPPPYSAQYGYYGQQDPDIRNQPQ